MSLLMQALKKAEHAKQNQDVPRDPLPVAEPVVAGKLAEMSLFPMEAPPLQHQQPEPALEPVIDIAPPLSAAGLAAEPALAPVVPPSAGLQVQDALAAPGMNEAAQAIPAAAAMQHDPLVSTPAARTEPVQPARSPANRVTQQDAAERQQALDDSKKVLLAQQQAKAVFSSKQTGKKRRAGTLAGLGLAAIGLFGGVFAYYYWQLSGTAMNQYPAVVASPAPASAPPVENTVPPAGGETPEAAAPVPAVAAVATAAQPGQPDVPARMPPSGTPTPQAAAAMDNAVRNDARASAALPAIAAAAAPAAAPAPAGTAAREKRAPAEDVAAEQALIQFKPGARVSTANPGLDQAYQAFIAGDLGAAQQQYERVVQREPNNRDALLGLAAIAVKRQQPEQAASHYVRLLDADPADGEAIAGLVSLNQGDPNQNESRLKKVLAQNPQSGAVLFALGNLYAQQSRWADAQQTYFRAYTTAPNNPDYAFNLAVSLDRLNQGKLALDYYRRALALHSASQGNFSPASVQGRIAELRAAADQ